MKKVWMRLLTALCIAAVLLTLPAFAAETGGTCGVTAQWTLEDGVLTISGSGDMYDYSNTDRAPWYEKRESIREVVITDGITAISRLAFVHLSAMEEIFIPDSVTRIGGQAFVGCSALTELIIPDGVITIEEMVFNECTNLRKITFGKNVSQIGSLQFMECINLKELRFLGDFPEMYMDPLGGATATAYYPADNTTWTEDKLKNYGGTITWVADSCTVHIWGDWAERKAPTETEEGLAERTCQDCGMTEQKTPEKLQPGLIDSGVFCDGQLRWSIHQDGTLTISGQGALPDYPHSAVEEQLPPWYPLRKQVKNLVVGEGITAIGTCNFCKLTALETVTLPNTLESIGEGSFSGDASLKSITIPQSVTQIAGSVFRDCTALESIVLPDSVTEIGIACFSGCTGLKTAVLSQSLAEIPLSLFYDCHSLESVRIGDAVATIAEQAFANCGQLTAVTIPASVTYIGRNAFAYCTALREVTFLGSPQVDMCVFSSNSRALQLIRFCGDVPALQARSMEDVYADCYYPVNNATWTSDMLQNYGGNLTWNASEDPAGIPGLDPMSGRCGSGTRWTLKDGTLTISGTGPMEYVGWELLKDQITKAVIEEGVTNVGSEAFSGCTKLKSVSIASTVTEIGGNAFNECIKLKSITLPDGLTTIHWYAFRNCEALKSIVIPNGVTQIADYAFFGCDNLESVTFSQALTHVGTSAFASCAELGELRFPATLVSLGDYAFAECTSVKKIYFYGDPPSVKNFTFKGLKATAYYPTGNEKWEDGGLGYCGGTIIEKPDPDQPNGQCQTHSYGDWVVTEEPTVLTNGARERVCTVCGHKQKEILAPIDPGYTQPEHPELGDPIAQGKWDGGNVLWRLYADGTLTVFGKRNMQGATNGNFPWKDYSDQITRIIVEEGLLSIAKMAFNDMPNLQTVELNTTLTKIDQEAFSNCPKLRSITIPASVTELGTAVFFNCTGLETVTFAEGCGLTAISSSLFANSGLTAVVIPEGVTSIGASAFSGCGNLAAVTLPEGLTTVSKSAFESCESLESLTIPSTLQSIHNDAFRYCTGLKHLELHTNVDYSYDFEDCPIESVVFCDSVQEVRGFDGCKTLTSVTLSDTVHTIGDSAFAGCPITSIHWPANLTTIEAYAFNGAKLTEVVLPETVTTVGKAAFAHNSELVSFTFSSGVTVMESGTLAGCESLVSVDLRNVTVVGFEAFSGCASLQTIYWPCVEEIGYYTFQNCTALTSLTIPASMKRMDHSVFFGCTGLAELTFPGDAPEMAAYVFMGLELTVYYPADSAGWDACMQQDHGGQVTWKAYCIGEHSFGDWTQTKAPTTGETGLEERICAVCGTEEQRELAKLEPEATEPEPTQPAPTQPEPTQPKPTETQPGTQDPAPSNMIGGLIAIGAAVLICCGGAVWFVLRKKK